MNFSSSQISVDPEVASVLDDRTVVLFSSRSVVTSVVLLDGAVVGEPPIMGVDVTMLVVVVSMIVVFSPVGALVDVVTTSSGVLVFIIFCVVVSTKTGVVGIPSS